MSKKLTMEYWKSLEWNTKKLKIEYWKSLKYNTKQIKNLISKKLTKAFKELSMRVSIKIFNEECWEKLSEEYSKRPFPGILSDMLNKIVEYEKNL